ncbi:MULTISPECIES: hypothetical protein [unclassified Lysobacter]|uniref:hypothetical protein n=1 Tax=unclassified Lysobacter TaxID=2635362 RepID=UPI001BE61039|nr:MULTISPECIES: hypothetical protein [unclassified Lysobacter]MBT2748243.1 hypothetical protein [Lysobacter sp. ISL-42]MBT2749990.1 hypothetical protein [Lysobacter sp. ISL-50]MBT2781318.1 hypothetical protein [Lysobacter sp. ISL-52]
MSQNKQPDPLLSTLPELLLALVEDQLSNNESSGDGELRDYFIGCGLSREQAERALEYRSAYMHMHLGAATPIRAGAAIRFNPASGDFDLI